MKKLIAVLLLLPLFSSAQQWVIWNNELWFKSGPSDSVMYGPSFLQPMIEVIKGRFDNVETNKLNVNGSGSQLTGITASQITFPEGTVSVPYYRRVSGSNATTTGQALTDIPGLSASLSANAVYEFYANLSVSTSAVTTGTQYGVNYTAAGASIEGTIMGSSTATAAKGERYSTVNANSGTYLATSAQNGAIKIMGTIVTGPNAADLRIRHLKVTSGTSTVFVNSTMRIIRIQ